jgi:two-component system chemotaxis sensor kinase CheA
VAAHLGEHEWRKINAALAARSRIAVVYYVPTPQQVHEGKNVNHVREQLKAQADLIKAIPIIQAGGVRFAFVVACAAVPAAPELAYLDWRPVAAEERADEPIRDQAPGVPAGVSVALGQPAPATSIRVDLSRMDELMRLVGDLVITRARIAEALPRLGGAAPAVLENLSETATKMERQVHNLREAVMRVRLVPLAEVFSRMPLTVRDLARTTGKQVQLTVEGGDTELDKALVDRLADPLMHIVRNAVTHGIEAPDPRAAAGKPAEGSIRLRGRTEGDHVIITVEDDGGGIAVERVQAQARALGWLADDRPLSNQDILDLLCRPGFSTQENADMGAGRGMGMNAAAAAITEMGGKFALDTQPGRGAIFTIQLPLTLTIINVLIVEAGGERYAVPQSIVNEVIEVVPGQIIHVMKHDLLPYRGSTLPLLSLHRAFGLPNPVAERWLGLVIGQAERQVAILVDRVLGLRETVVRPLSDPLVAEPGISGATELGDGSVVLILNGAELLSHFQIELLGG